MNVDLKCQPSYTMAYCELDHDEGVYVEPGAMACLSAGIDVGAGLGGQGAVKALVRKTLGGEHFFMAHYRAKVHGAWVAIAPKYPGDVVAVPLDPARGLCVERGALLAFTHNVDASVKWGGMRTVVMREGAVVLHLTGAGQVLLSSYGGFQFFDLDPEMTMIVDTGHLVAWEDTVKLNVGTFGGVSNAVLTGEGLVADLRGPGRIWVQTRAEQALRDWLLPDPEQNTGR